MRGILYSVFLFERFMSAILCGAAAPVLSTAHAGPAATTTTTTNATVATTAAWDELRAVIDDFDLIPNLAFSVGDARGEIFRHSKGETDFSTQMGIASATKWVSGVMVMATVERGLGGLALDDLAFERLDYWTRDPEDPRSRVTLRHLLSFTSGMAGSTACPAEMDFNTCVRDMYERSTSNFEPGSTVVCESPTHSHPFVAAALPLIETEKRATVLHVHATDNEVHLMYAGGMAAAASGISVEELFQNFVFVPAGMTSTVWGSANGRPLLGSGISTTPEDYGAFLDAYFNHRLVSEATVVQ